MTYRLHTANITLKPRETKVVKFPWGYFKSPPIVTLTSTSNVNLKADEITKNHFLITNPISRKIIVSYAAIIRRNQKVIRIYSDIDSDGIPDVEDSDIDGDGFSNQDEISAGTDPYDSQSFPAATPKYLYIGLKANDNVSFSELLSFYFGEMSDLTYPTIADLQPDSSGASPFEIISPTDPAPDIAAIESQRIKKSGGGEYTNTTPDSALFRIDNLDTNKNYKLFTLSSVDALFTPEIKATFVASNSSNENEHTVLGNVNDNDYINLLPYTDTSQFTKQYFIHQVNISNNNQVTFTADSQNSSPYEGFFGGIHFHTKYSGNSDSSNPNVEIAIQEASYDGTDDGQSGPAGYVSNFDLESISGNYSLTQATTNNYTSLTTAFQSDSNTDNHARFGNGLLGVGTRYRMHVKVGNGTDCTFQIHLKTSNSIAYESNLTTYNNSYDQNSNLDYYHIIPSDGNTAQRTYYHYFTVREDGFIIWEHNKQINS